MNQNEQVRTITVDEANQIRDFSKEAIAEAEALERLQNNADFKLVFLGRYFEKEPQRLVGLLGDYNLNTKSPADREINREEIKECMIGIARLRTFMRGIYQRANEAQKMLEDLQKSEAEFYAGSSVVGD
mgnify:CR=1 FL=1